MAVTQQPETRIAITSPKQLEALAVSDWGRARLEAFVPPGESLERIGRIIALEARKVPSLLKCDPVSLMDATARILKWGLVPGETAFLVPFGTECTPIKGAEGIIQLMYDSGHVRAVDARVVYEGEPFKIVQGLNPVLEHEPLMSAKERGVILGAYCIIRLAFGNFVMEWYPADWIDSIRQKHSKQWKSGALPAWYCRKTAVIHTAKLLPKNSKFAKLHAEAQREEEEEISALEKVEAKATLMGEPEPLHGDDTPADFGDDA